MAEPELSREDLAAALEARAELGKELEPQVVESFLERVEKEIDARVDARLAKRRPQRHGVFDQISLAVPLGSLGMGIPLTAIAAGEAGLTGIVVAWLGIVGVNLAYALARFHR